MIKNARNVLLGEAVSTLPDVSVAMLNWFRPMIFMKICKQVVNFVVSEVNTEIRLEGVWQSLNPKQLMIKPEGQRSWNWYQLHASTTLVLDVDEIIEYSGVRYRVMSRIDQTGYGYVEYHLVNDFTGGQV